MKQFGIIFKFELKNYLTNKIFVGVTLFLAAAIAVVMFFPRIIGLFDSDKDAKPFEGRPVMMVEAEAFEDMEAVREAFAAAFPEYSVKVTQVGLEAVKEQITGGFAECAIMIDSMTSYSYYVNNLSMYDSNSTVAGEVLKSLYQREAMVDGGFSREEAERILEAEIVCETVSLGKDQIQNFFYTYIMIFALYMVILLYGQMVATNVATEKSSRAMEVLITSAKPVSMMFGKVIASCLAGLLQLVAVFGVTLLSFRLNRSFWADNAIMESIFDMPVELLLYMLIFFVLGFLIYAFMYGAIGSTASKLEDINTSVMPVTLIFIVAFMVVIMSMTSGTVDSLLMKVCSYIPFTSPMAMFTRIAMSTVPFYEIALSIIILAVSVAAVGVIAAKIYRVGVLLYGASPKLGALWKAIRKA